MDGPVPDLCPFHGRLDRRPYPAPVTEAHRPHQTQRRAEKGLHPTENRRLRINFINLKNRMGHLLNKPPPHTKGMVLWKLNPQLYTHIYDESQFIPPNGSRCMCKPQDGGLWTSTYNPEIGSRWIEWCKWEDFRLGDIKDFVSLLYPKICRVFIIDSEEDARRFLTEFGIREDYYYESYEIDFEKFAKQYDALHLTDKGQYETRFMHPPTFYGWDCESTLWMRPMFVGMTTIPREENWMANPYEEEEAPRPASGHP